MSRRTVKSADPLREIIVGWDPPLGTFFAQVMEMPTRDDPDPDCLLWIGLRHGEITQVDDLLAQLEPWADLSDVRNPVWKLVLLADRVVNDGASRDHAQRAEQIGADTLSACDLDWDRAYRTLEGLAPVPRGPRVLERILLGK